MSEPAIGVIGGSGLYQMEGLEALERVAVDTPFGAPSDAFLTGRLEGKKMVFLPRHGAAHHILPHEIDFRANIWAMKKLGVTRIVSVSAVGSMREAIVPGHLVLADQFIDRTRRRIQTFYGDGIVVHVPFADPVCPAMHTLMQEASGDVGAKVHPRGTYVCIDGPQFSTRAESLLYRSWGVDVIGMTNLPEAKLAREAEICYATIALATDYDAWHETEESVSVEGVLRTLKANVERARALIRRFVARVPAQNPCALCPTAARTSLMTLPERIPRATWERLEPIVGAFLPRPAS